MKTEKYLFYLFEEVAGIGDQSHQFKCMYSLVV